MAFGTRSTTFAFIAEDKFSKTADKVAGKSSSMGDKFAKAGKLVARTAAVGAATTAALGYAGLKAVKVHEEQATASARLAKVYESMGYPKRAAEVDRFADSLEQKIAVDSSEIKAAQAKLATFDDVAKSTDLMKRATKLAADSAAAGFGSMDSASVGLGKALQDPVTGMSLLSKQGSLTKQQQKEIGDEFLRTGDKAAAQESILGALEKQVGGVAEATADSSDKMSLAMGEVTESIGGALAPAFDKLVPVVQRVSDWFVKTAMPAMGDFARKHMPMVRDIMGKVQQAFEDNRPALQKLGDAIKVAGQFVGEYVIPMWGKWVSFVIPKLIDAIGWVIDTIAAITPMALKVAKVYVASIGKMVDGTLAFVENTVKLLAKVPGPWQEGMREAAKSVEDFRDDAKRAFDRIEKGLDDGAKAVEDYNRKSKLKTDISDSKRKIKELVRELNSPDVTKTRKVEIRAELQRLKDQLKEAKRRLRTVKDVTVELKANMTIGNVKVSQAAATKFNRYNPGGGMGSGHGLMSATAGVGSPGAAFKQWGPMWSWNRGPSGMGQHDGADISAGYGTPVYAPSSGSFSRRLTGSWHGNAVQWNKNGTTFTYAHLSRFGGSQPGGVIGYVGSTGNSTGAHLHIQARRNGSYVDPAAWLAQGGIVKARPGGTIVGVGEGGRDEAVVPLPRGWQSGAGGGGDVVVKLVLDGRTIQESVIRHEARTGRPVLTKR